MELQKNMAKNYKKIFFRYFLLVLVNFVSELEHHSKKNINS
jgi:hypothetical protein